MKIGKGRLTLDKLEVHQPTKHKQRALRAAILKPPMLAAVDLDQLAGRSRAGSGVDGRVFVAACDRATTRLRSSTAAVFLDRQGRAKIPVPLADLVRQRCGGAGLRRGSEGSFRARLFRDWHPLLLPLRPDFRITPDLWTIGAVLT